MEPQALSNEALMKLVNEIKDGKKVQRKTYLSHNLDDDIYQVLDNRNGQGAVIAFDEFDEAHAFAAEPFYRENVIYFDRDNMFNQITFLDDYRKYKKGDMAIEEVGESGMPGTAHYIMPATKEIAEFITNLDEFQDNVEIKQAFEDASKNWRKESDRPNLQLDDLTLDQLNAIREVYLPKNQNIQEKNHEIKEESLPISTQELAKQAHKAFVNGTKDANSLEEFVNRSSKLMRYSDTRYHNGGNRMLLMDDPTNARYYLSRTELQAAQVYNIDYDQLKGRNVFAINPNNHKSGQPVKFDVGKLYSINEISQHYPQLTEKVKKIAISHMPYNKVDGRVVYASITDACNKNYVMYPNRRKDPLVAARARITKQLAFGKAGFIKQQMHFTEREKDALDKLTPKELGQLYQSASRHAWIVDQDLSKNISQHFEMKNEPKHEYEKTNNDKEKQKGTSSLTINKSKKLFR